MILPIQGSPTESFLKFTDQDGNSLVSLNKDGSINTSGIRFPDGTISLSAAPTMNEQVGVSYAINTSDFSRLVTFSNTSPVSVSLAAAGASTFFNGWYCLLQNVNTGFVTVTPTGSTINSWPSIVLAPYQYAFVFSDGTNYFAMLTKATSTDSATSLSGYMGLDAGGAVAGNQIIMVDHSTAGVNTKRKALNIYILKLTQL